MRRILVSLPALLLLLRCLPPELSSGPASGGTASSAGAANGDAGSIPASTAGKSNASTGGSSSASVGGQPNEAAGEAGGGGEASVGGRAGAGGEPTVVQEDVDVIDDMEDGDAQIAIKGGRNGFWFTANDGTPGATQLPTAAVFEMATLPAGDRSTHAAHTQVSGFKAWGSLMGFNFVEQVSLKPYDASAACGIRFWAKAAAATTVAVQFPDLNTHPAGQVCLDTGEVGATCSDHFQQVVKLTTKWQQYVVNFQDLTQVGYGYGPPDGKVRKDALYSLQWRLPSTDRDFEIWIDDLVFTLPHGGDCF